MTTSEIVDEYVLQYPGTLVTPTIAKAWAAARFGCVSIQPRALERAMRAQLRPHSAGVYVAAPRPLTRPQGEFGL